MIAETAQQFIATLERMREQLLIQANLTEQELQLYVNQIETLDESIDSFKEKLQTNSFIDFAKEAKEIERKRNLNTFNPCQPFTTVNRGFSQLSMKDFDVEK